MADRIATLAMSTPAIARAFVGSLRLADPPAGMPAGRPAQFRSPFKAMFGALEAAAPAPAAKMWSAVPVADAAEVKIKSGVEQAFIVGSQLVSFDAEVTAERRAAAVNSCLLAQLHASTVHPNPSTAAEAFEWHAAYINVLVNIGWVLQSGVSARQGFASNGAQVSTALLDLITALIPGGTALVIATKVFDSLKALNASDPFITLYASRVVEQNLVEFGASMGTADSTGFLLQVVECAVEIKTDHRELLFFKWDATGASIDGRSYKLSLSDDVFAAVAAQIDGRVKPYVQSFVRNLELPPAP